MESLPSFGIDYSALIGTKRTKSITAYILGKLIWHKDHYRFDNMEITWVTGDRKEFAMGEW
jgi:hypothetical protein